MHVEPSALRDLRARMGWTVEDVARELAVSARGVRLWESGKRRIPYASFRLLRLMAGSQLPWPEWRGFWVRGGTLYSPEGHQFAAADLTWLSLLCRRARMFHELYRQIRPVRQVAS